MRKFIVVILLAACYRLTEIREGIEIRTSNELLSRHEIILTANLMQQGNFINIHTTYAAALKTTIHPKTRCRKPYAATQRLMFLMMGVCTRNMSS